MNSSWLPRLTYGVATRVRGEPSYAPLLEDLREVERLSPDEARQRQGRRLASLLEYAQQAVPYYGEVLDISVPISAASAHDILAGQPILRKETLQKHSGAMRGDSRERVTRKSTSGSTGQPVSIIKSARAVAVERACSWLGLGWFGISVGDPAVRFWGTALTRKQRLRSRLADLAMNRIRISAFDLQDGDLARYYERILAFQAKWFYGYASLIDMFAEWIERSGRSGERLNLHAIVPTSESLSHEQRQRIERVFGALIQNEYGCSEAGPLAYECPEGKLHVMTESVVLEIVDDDGSPAKPGETGTVLITDLHNRAMPLIRYRIGDQASVGEPCTCGRPFPTLAGIAGRTLDVVRTPDGTRWHGDKMAYLMTSMARTTFPFRGWQVVQKEPDLLEVRLVADTPIPEAVRVTMRQYVHNRLGMRCRVVEVQRIDREPGGKLRLVKNEVRVR